MRGTLLWLGLHAADLVAISLPRPLAYALAGLVGRVWHRLAHERRALVTDQLARVSQLVLNTTKTLANMDQRLTVDGPKPDPKGQCRQ